MCTRHFLLCPLLLDCRRFFLHPQLISFVLLLARRRITPFREDLCFCSVAGHLIVRCPIAAIAFAAFLNTHDFAAPKECCFSIRLAVARSLPATSNLPPFLNTHDLGVQKSAVSRNRATSPLYISEIHDNNHAQNVQLQHVCAPGLSRSTSVNELLGFALRTRLTGTTLIDTSDTKSFTNQTENGNCQANVTEEGSLMQMKQHQKVSNSRIELFTPSCGRQKRDLLSLGLFPRGSKRSG